MIHKNEMVRPVAQGFYLMLLTIIFIGCIAVIIAPASAITETITLTESSLSATSYTQTASNVYSGTVKMYVDFAQIGHPTMLSYYFTPSVSPHPSQSGTFETRVGTTLVSTGTYQITNGTYYEGNTNLHMDFTSWDSGAYNTCQQMNTTFTPALDETRAIDNHYIKAAGKVNCYQTDIPPTNNPLQFDRLDGSYYATGGNYHLLKGANSGVTITMTNASYVSPSGITLFSLTKSGTSPNLIRIYSNNNSLAYQGSTDLLPFSSDVIGADIWASMYVPASATFKNSSIYFPYFTGAGAIPTPTPTPTTTGVPSGWIETYFQCVDGKDNGAIYGCNLNLHDEFNNTWSNVTNDSDGTHKIATHTGATVGGYATATGYASTSRTGLTPFVGIYELIMWPLDSVCTTPGSCGTVYDPGLGSINLIILVNDGSTDSGIAGATVKLVESSGSTLYGSTNQAGVEEFMMTNETTFRIVVEANGYQSASKMHTTSAFGPDSVRIELTKSYATVTPTVIITDGSGNVVQTIDTRSASVKDQALTDKLRDAGPGILDLAIAGITIFILMGILGLFGVKFN